MTDAIKNEETPKEEEVSKKEDITHGKTLKKFHSSKLSSLPRIEKLAVQTVFDLLPEELKLPSVAKIACIKYPELQKSLDENGYNPEKYNYIILQRRGRSHITDIVSGKKRVMMLHTSKPNMKISILRVEALPYRLSESELKKQYGR